VRIVSLLDTSFALSFSRCVLNRHRKQGARSTVLSMRNRFRAKQFSTLFVELTR